VNARIIESGFRDVKRNRQRIISNRSCLNLCPVFYHFLGLFELAGFIGRDEPRFQSLNVSRQLPVLLVLLMGLLSQSDGPFNIN
jgi:hypothetical protein